MSKVFCLILNYNRPGDTVACARSLHASRLPNGTEIVVIDNDAKNLKEYFRKELASAIYLKSPSNLGFAAGNNVGIRYALEHGATHILIINPDVTVPRNFLLPLLQNFKGSIGIVAPAHTEGQGIYGLGGTIDWKWGTFEHENVAKLPAKSRLYDFLTFACVLIKKEVLEKVGLLDERYFMYLEDVDYCVTTKRAGFNILLNPSVVVTHRTSSSFADPRSKIRLSLRSCLLFIHKWYRLPQNILPVLHALYFYPYTYLLWTLKLWKQKRTI